MGKRYSHDYACALTDGTPYRLGVRRGSSDREVHVEDADRILDRLEADPGLAAANWLVVFMLPDPCEYISAGENTA